MRLIDADMLLKEIENIYSQAWAGRDFADIVQQQPTINANPVKHGRWIIGQCGKDKYIKCSVCKARIVDTIVSLEGDISQDYFVICPRCGARMDGDTNA